MIFELLRRNLDILSFSVFLPFHAVPLLEHCALRTSILLLPKNKNPFSLFERIGFPIDNLGRYISFSSEGLWDDPL